MNLAFSIVIAIYNRSEELRELLTSLTLQTDQNFEVIVADDASSENLYPVIQDFEKKIKLKYVKKERNSGCGATFNFGAEFASGNYLISLDSDCIIPVDFIDNLRQALTQNYTDAYGGADAAHPDFNFWQKAVSYAMTSFLTTGGLRGKQKSVNKFQPRGYNMGVSKKVFEILGGFSKMRAQDIDFVFRLWEQGFSTQFIPKCTVFHKRRTSFQHFAKQMYGFGVMRPILDQMHPKYQSLTFLFPLFFSLSFLVSIFLKFSTLILLKIPFLLFWIYTWMILIDATLKNKNIIVGLLAVFATYLQFFAYGWGYLKSYFWIRLLKKDPVIVFPHFF